MTDKSKITTTPEELKKVVLEALEHYEDVEWGAGRHVYYTDFQSVADQVAEKLGGE